MEFNPPKKPRKFNVGKPENQIVISDFGDLHLSPDEQISIVSDSGKRHDFACKDWGFYLTPSINGRLKNEGFKTALVDNPQGKIFILSVNQDSLDLFEKYCMDENLTVLEWLDERELRID